MSIMSEFRGFAVKGSAMDVVIGAALSQKSSIVWLLKSLCPSWVCSAARCTRLLVRRWRKGAILVEIGSVEQGPTSNQS